MSEYRFALPRPPRESSWGSVVSVVVHVAVTVAVVAVAGPSFELNPPAHIILFDPSAPGPREYPINFATGTPAEETEVGPGAGVEGEADGRGVIAPLPTTRIGMEMFDSLPRPDTVLNIVGPREQPPGPDLTEGRGPIGTGRRLGPAYAGGYLWVRPYEAELGVVGPSETRAIHLARVDEAVRERIKDIVDAMPRDSFALPPPTIWTTRIGEDTWGIDGSWIYLGDFKVPTAAVMALLSFLPLPQSDFDRSKDAQQLAAIREDIIRTARQLENTEEIKKYIVELRKRKDEEREAARAKAAEVKKDTVKPIPDGG